MTPIGPSWARNPLERLPGSWNSGLVSSATGPSSGRTANEAPKSPKNLPSTGGASGLVKSKIWPVFAFPPDRIEAIAIGWVETVCEPRPMVIGVVEMTAL